MAYFNQEVDDSQVKGIHISDRAFFWGSTAILGVIIFTLVLVSSIFMEGDWASYDVQRFYAMAEEIVRGATPYLDYQDPKPPLIFFTLTIPIILGYKLLGGLLLVGLCNFISAILLMKIAWALYGRFSGFMAGLLFTANIAWAQGYFVITEPFTLVFILLSMYIMLFTDISKKYLISGICVGIAIGFKQYALLMLPLSLYFMYRKGELHSALEFIGGAMLPLLLIFGAIFCIYGADAGQASLYWSFGIAGTYATQGSIGDVPGYRPSNPLIYVANLVLAISVFTSLLIIAIASFLHDRPVTFYETYFFLAGLAFSSTLLIRQYLHYWILALPFIALMCARLFRNRR